MVAARTRTARPPCEIPAPWAPLDAAAFAAAAGDFAASRVKTAEAKEALSTSSTALVSIIAEEATAANVQISERSDFST